LVNFTTLWHFYGPLVYLLVIWYFCSVLVNCREQNLATLLSVRAPLFSLKKGCVNKVYKVHFYDWNVFRSDLKRYRQTGKCASDAKPVWGRKTILKRFENTKFRRL
jgi:hypothetical protein